VTHYAGATGDGIVRAVRAMMRERGVATDYHGSMAADAPVGAELRGLLDRGLAPRAVAVYGASDRRLNSQAARIAKAILGGGYEGRVALVNPRAQTVHGVETVPSARDSALAGTLDFAVVSVPREQVSAALNDCIDAGIKLAIVTSARFGESDDTGAQLQAALQRQSARGLRFFGPNCMGLINFTDKLYASNPLYVPTRSGSISLFGQSGSLSVRIMQVIAAECGQGLDLWITMGNSANLDIPTMLSYSAGRDTTSVAVVYLENVSDPDRLRDGIRAMRAAGKEVVLLKSGRTEIGGAAAMSHTGAMSSPDEFVDVLVEETGCIRAYSVREAGQIASIIATTGRPRGPFAVVGTSGGDCVVVGDMCTALRVPLSRLDAATATRMRAAVPQTSTTNPIDITPFSRDSGHESELLRAIAHAPDVGALVMLDGWHWRYDDGSLVPPGEFASFFKDLGLDVPVIHDSEMPTEELEALGAAGVAVTADGETIWRSLARIASGTDLAAPSAVTSPPAAAPLGPSDESPAPARRAVPELEAFERLTGLGLPMIDTVTVESRDVLARVCADLGFPVVLKGLISGVTHKAARQLVRIGVTSLEEAESVWQDLDAVVRVEGGRVVAQPQIQNPRAEVIIGTRDDPHFGLHIMVGEGGRWADREPDNAWARAAIDIDAARRLLAKTRIGRRLLADPVGSSDVDGVARAISQVSRIAAEHRAEIAEIEINPLLVRASDVVAVDALILLR
jgi:acetate---CoA ligase (ADP-forming)